ncbi:ABC transporter permease [Frateuria terrea]|uniref:Putative ABC transport system permease protein n=1 Tax=Frateuria terrea TaxID=529704 RepID=A0A1H6RAA6_9GAMM|nr:FtsX-like permease family protein [Frateuria terrea]SEI50174.1 putative ABC transport system permease protein [Frateuria terrea]SFP15329.1 putative ABC transport system permease protein [Frateuria terrea]
MDVLPILSTLRRHKITALLVVLEIALTCAIVCNAVFLISQRLERMQMTSGIAEHELVQIQAFGIGKPDDARAHTQEDLAALRQIPGVKSVALVNEVPFTNSSWNSSIKLDPKQKLPTLNATQYFGEDLLSTFGAKLVAGRNFNPDEYLEFRQVQRDETLQKKVTGVIITRALGEKLWPGQSALGKPIYLGDDSVRVIGVVEGLIRPSLFNGDDTAQWSMVFPLRMDTGNASRYVLRTAPKDRERVLAAAAATLRKANPHRIIQDKKTLDDIRGEFFQDDRAMAGLLAGVCIALLVVTALGIVGLGSFWVAQRRRTIGVRRALGATRRNILHYFQTENFLLATIGIALGMVLAYGINLFLMLHYELPRLPAYYFPVGAVVLWLIGQAAVLGPAMRAAAVPPVVATRSV